MCDTCGCNITPGNRHLLDAPAHGTAIDVLQGLLSANDRAAEHNRTHLNQHRVLAINLMSAPGAGKTSLLEATIDLLQAEFRIGVIEGDLETENDARRIRAKGVPAIQISTGSACHLDAHMVHHALHQLPLAKLDVVFIENVGNLVCPASFDLGHHRNVTLLSVTEGDDKPAKYPVMFRGTDMLLISKIDLLPVFDDFNPQQVQQHMRHLANNAPIMQIAVRHGAQIDPWLHWLREEYRQFQEGLIHGNSPRPRMQNTAATSPAEATPRYRQVSTHTALLPP